MLAGTSTVALPLTGCSDIVGYYADAAACIVEEQNSFGKAHGQCQPFRPKQHVEVHLHDPYLLGHNSSFNDTLTQTQDPCRS